MRRSLPAIYEPRLVESRVGGPRSRPWRVRRKVDGRDTSTHFARKQDAWRYYSDLVEARDLGLRFDPETGEPAAWARDGLTAAEWAHRWFRARFTFLMPRTRAAYVEVLAEVLPLLVKARSPRLDEKAGEALARDIRAWLATEAGPTPAYLAKHSLLLADLANVGVCLAADAAITRRRDGRMRSAQTVQRYRVTIGTWLNAAVAAGHLEVNPWPTARARAVKERLPSRSVDRGLLPSVAEVEDIVGRLGDIRTGATGAYEIIVWLCFLAGLRPGEARALHIEDLSLPTSGWGEIVVRRAVSDAPSELRGEDPVIGETKTGRVRRVPISPRLVALLRTHIGERTEGLVATTSTGRPVGASALNRAWNRALGGRRMRLYDLRHSCATRWLSATRNVAEVARRLGHSPDVLLRIYAGVLPGDEEQANARIEEQELRDSTC